MSNFIKSTLLLFVIFLIQFIIYSSLIQDEISTWNASKNEISAKMQGDNIAPFIVSTRAITIDANVKEVWNTLVTLGADRGGFFAYTFLERLLGFEAHTINVPKDYIYDMRVGRLVPTTAAKDEKYSFLVVASKKYEYFVLEGWGSFALKQISNTQTRLIIRTHGLKGLYTWAKVSDLVFEPFHYIMEKRMLLGIKNKIENPLDLDSNIKYDVLWFSSLVLSALLILVFIYKNNSFVCFIFASIYSFLWLYCLLIFNPLSLYAFGLLVLVFISIILLPKKVIKNRWD
ncbi:MAG: hypothetical protein HRT41_12115 [Campylobacteraceae bacterium]|nr:hypothetical protein [Campylobacteraceae bacterium]